ncbi:Fc.00g066430.m01.CDS01 [Cosmosporella sp. VM-42]
MALTVKQLNGDASLLLSFEPIIPLPGQKPFRILLDPCVAGPLHTVYSKHSPTTHTKERCISSLQELPEPDLVIISQHKTEHCNKTTLKQLARTNTKTILLAEPGAAKVIRSWKYFSKDKIIALERWQDPRLAGKETITRVAVPPHTLGGIAGEVTIAFIPQRRDIKGIHSAIGITYRPPPSRPLPFYRPVLTPPTTPKHTIQEFAPRIPPPTLVTSNTMTFTTLVLGAAIPAFPPPTPPESPPLRALRAARSTATLSAHARDRAVSVIFSPHGVSYRSLKPYATSHLLTEAALPLTALLHCFNTVSQPWWLGGTVRAGMPVGQEIASALGAQAWVSTHDGEKNVHVFAGKVPRTRKYRQDEVKRGLSQASNAHTQAKSRKPSQTEILVLGAGQEVALTSEGVWEPDTEVRPSTSSMLL